MSNFPDLFLARIPVGRAIRNLFDGIAAGETWAVALAAVLVLVAIGVSAYFAFQVYQEASTESDDVELTPEEKNLMNRF